ncbi:Hypothetical predicted protein [Xyrichtys novacula]|uniref:Uncharacterized protein n=1 Tax=Xyrichtys novacula TaxID=13765 RepID=A0AAV1G3Y6_XYRNO|nr:Hypothetical predicted protein [Xyrichtys novacula]
MSEKASAVDSESQTKLQRSRRALGSGSAVRDQKNRKTDLYIPAPKTSNINTSSRVNNSSFLSSDFTSTLSASKLVLIRLWFQPGLAATLTEPNMNSGWESRLFTHLCALHVCVWVEDGVERVGVQKTETEIETERFRSDPVCNQRV